MPIKATSQLTPYEKMYNEAKSHTGMFDQKAWSDAVKSGQSDMYLAALRKSDTMDLAEFNKVYNNEFASEGRKLNALYNEAFADRENQKLREYTTYDGTTHKEMMSDYDYTKRLLQERNNYEMNQFNEKLAAQKAEEETSFAEKLGRTVAGMAMEVGSGAADVVNTIALTGRALIDTIATDVSGGGGIVVDENGARFEFGKFKSPEEMMDHFVSFFNDVYQKDTFLSQWAYEMEKSSYMRDYNGNITGFGKYASGVTFTIGQMLPGMMFGQAAGGAVGGLTGSAKAAGIAATAASKGSFYGSITMQRINEAYANMLVNDTTVDTGAAVLNGVIKAGVEIGVEEILGKLLGTSALDAMFFNKTVTAGTGDLTLAGIKRILASAGQEGLEEVLQDAATYFVDVAFDAYLKTDYWKDLTSDQISYQSLMDSFLIGALTSVAGSASKIITRTVDSKVHDAMVKHYDSVLAGDLDADTRADIEAKRDAAKRRASTKVIVMDGDNVVEKSLSPFAQYEYDLDMESFVRNIAYVIDNYIGIKEWIADIEAGITTIPEGFDKNSLKKIRNGSTVAAMQAYNAFRMITSIYSGMSQERIDQANTVLRDMKNVITKSDIAKDKGVKYEASLNFTREMLSQFGEIRRDTVQKVAEHLAKTGATKVEATITADTNSADFDDDTQLAPETVDKLKSLINDGSVENVVIADKTDTVEIIDNTLVADVNSVTNATAMDLMRAASEPELIKVVGETEYAKTQLSTITAAYRELNGHENATDEEAIRALLFDKEFFHMVLFTYGNRDMYQFLRSLSDMTEMTRKNTKEEAFVSKLTDVLTSMRSSLMDYAINVPQVNVEEVVELFPKQKQSSVRDNIIRMRWMWDVRQRVVNSGMLSEEDKATLKRVINNTPTIRGEDKKTGLYAAITSPALSQRRKAMRILEQATNIEWTSSYNGKVYLPAITIGNNIFNQFLRRNNLTLDNWLNESALSGEDREYIKAEGLKDITEYRRKQFQSFAPKYNFELKDGALTIYGGNKIEGFNTLHEQVYDMAKKRDYDEAKVKRLRGKNTKEIVKMINSSVDPGTALYVTVNDLIMNPRLLSNSLQAKIIDKYGTLDQDSTRAYLAIDYFPNLYKNKLLTLVEFQDGTYGLAEATNMLTMYRKNVKMDFKPNKQYKLESLMKDSALPGVMKDTIVEFVDAVPTGSDAYFVGYEKPAEGFNNTIRVSNTLIDENPKYLQYIIAHEAQHGYQTVNFMNNGSGDVITKNDPRLTKLIAEFKIHAPEVIQNENGNFYKSREVLRDRINTFLYYGTGEYDAHGFAGSEAIKFTPVISAYEYIDGKFKNTIKLPWGTVLSDDGDGKFTPLYKKIAKADSYWRYDSWNHQLDYYNKDDSTVYAKDTITGKILMLHPDDFARSEFVAMIDSLKQGITLRKLIESTKQDMWRKIQAPSTAIAKYIQMQQGVTDDWSRNETVKRELMDFVAKNPEAQELSKLMLYIGSGHFFNSAMTFKEYLNTTVPIIRVQYGNQIFGDSVVSFDIVDTSTYNNFVSGNAAAVRAFTDAFYEGGKATIFYGQPKVKDIFFAIDSDHGNEIIMRSTDVKNYDYMDIDLDAVEDDDTRTISSPLMKRSISTGKAIKDSDWTQLKDGRWKKVTEGTQYTKYSRKIEYFTEKAGDPKTTRIGKPRYILKEKPKSRSVSASKYEGTDLKYFKKPGKRLQMPIALQKFIEIAGDRGVDPTLMEKINGSQRGTLTTFDVMRYFRNNSKMDEATFSAINDAFYQNDYIKTNKELEDLVAKAPQFFVTRDILKNVDKKYLTTTNQDLIDTAMELVAEDPKFKTKYDKLTEQYNTQTPSGKYLRRLLMLRYDGTIDSAASAAKTAWWAAKHGYDVTGEVTVGRSLQGKAGTSEKSNKALEEVVGDTDADLDEYDANDETTARASRRSYGGYTETDVYYNDLSDEDIEMKKKIVMDAIANADKTKLVRFLLASSPDLTVDLAEAYIDSLDMNEFAAILEQKLMTTDESIIDRMLQEVTSETGPKVTSTNLTSIKVDGKTVTTDKLANSINYTLNVVIGKRLNRDQKKLLGTQHPELFDANGNFRNDLRYDGRKLKPIDDLNEIKEQLLKVRQEIKDGVYSDKESVRRFNKFLAKQQKVLEDMIKSTTSQPKPTIDTITSKPRTVKLAGEEIRVTTDRDMPDIIRQMLNTELTKTDKSRVTYVSNDTDEHIVMNINTFVDQNSDSLLNMDSEQANDIVDYYTHTTIVPETNRAKLYVTVQELALAYVTNLMNREKITLTPENKQALMARLDVTAGVAGTILAVRKQVLDKLNPDVVIGRSLMKHLDLDWKDPDLEKKVGELSQAIVNGNPNDIKTQSAEFFALAQAKAKSKKSFVDTWLDWQKVAMLSGPGTWVRNWATNATIGGLYTKTGKRILPGFTQAHDALIQKLSNTQNGLVTLLRKLYKVSDLPVEDVTVKTPESLKKALGPTHIVKQYNIPVIKATDEAINFVRTNVVNNGLLNSIKDSSMKYDTNPKVQGKTISDLIISSTYVKLNREIGFYKLNDDGTIRQKNGKNVKTVLGFMQDFVYKALSDDPWVDRRFAEILAKTLTADKLDLSQGITDDIAAHIADAYSYAASEYMHKGNIVFALERKFRKSITNKLGKGAGDLAWFAWKQFFPFAGAGTNWAIAGLKATPAGLAAAIVRLNKLEKTIEKMENAQAKEETVKNIEFQKYIAQRDITTGLIGTISWIIGTILVAIGAISLKDDDQYGSTIMIGDFGLDISDIYMSNGFMLGVTLVDSIKKNANGDVFDAIGSVAGDVLTEALNQFVLADLYSTMRYTNGVGDMIVDTAIGIPLTMIPNMWKTVVNITKTRDMKFSSKFEGRVQRQLSNILPMYGALKYAEIDPYTGNPQVKYLDSDFGTVMLNALNKLAGVVKIYPYTISENEKIAVRYGVNKTSMTGQFKINGENVKLSTSGIQLVNEFYGQLNDTDLTSFYNGKSRYVIERNGKRVSLKFSQMTDEEKGSTIKRIMSNNATIAKIYIMTQAKNYKYYASEEQYKRLIALGIRKNIYRSTTTKQGFVK